MGEVAEMMLDGTLCQSCGVYVGTPCGYPRDCADCRRTQTSSKRRCKHCGKALHSEQAMRDHVRAKHGGK